MENIQHTPESISKVDVYLEKIWIVKKETEDNSDFVDAIMSGNFGKTSKYANHNTSFWDELVAKLYPEEINKQDEIPSNLSHLFIDPKDCMSGSFESRFNDPDDSNDGKLHA